MGKSIADLGSMTFDHNAMWKDQVWDLHNYTERRHDEERYDPYTLADEIYDDHYGRIDDQVYQDRYDPEPEDLIAECNDWGDDGCSVCTNNKCSRAYIPF